MISWVLALSIFFPTGDRITVYVPSDGEIDCLAMGESSMLYAGDSGAERMKYTCLKVYVDVDGRAEVSM